MAEPEAVERLQATFEAAQSFGLSTEECWEVAREARENDSPDEPAVDSLERVVEALAARIEGRE
jgi:hypothetical protein